MHVTIIIPTYNERENIAKIVPMISTLLPQVDILVVDDNSPDKTYDVVREMQKTIPNLSLLLRQKKEGLGKAYIEAFRMILNDGKSDAVIMMDADFSHDPKYLPVIIKEAEKFDVVIGSRYVKGGKINDWNFQRKLLSRFGNMYARTIVGIPIHDYTSGFNFIKTDILRRIDLGKIAASGYAFLLELKSLLWKAGAQLKEMPITLYDRTLGESKISGNIIREGMLTPWKIRFSRLNSNRQEEKYFFELNLHEIENTLILLDIDGTLIHDGSSNIDEKNLDVLKKLYVNNKVIFCSNKNNCVRNQAITLNTSVPCLDIPHKKPNKKILKFIQNENNLPLLVIGDKFLTDGLFARNIKAKFIKVRRITSVNDAWYIKLSYFLDDIIFWILK